MEEDKVILVYPGFWSGPVFKNGEEALVFVSLRTRSYKEFLDEVHKLVQADRSFCEYVLHCFIHTEDGVKKSFILSDRDLQRVAKIFRTPKIHVSFKLKHQYKMNGPADGNLSLNHHGVLEKAEDNVYPFPSGGYRFGLENAPYAFPYWWQGQAGQYFPAPWMHGAWPGSAPGETAPVPNQPKPGSTRVVNKPNPNLASVVNQPTPGSKVAEHTRMLKRALDASKPTNYGNNGAYKPMADSTYYEDVDEDEDEDEDEDGSAPVTNQLNPGSPPVINQPRPGLAPVVNQPRPVLAPVVNQPKPGSVPVVNQPKPGSAAVVNQPKLGSAPITNQPKPGSAPVVNQPRPGSAPVVNQPRPGSTPVVNQFKGSKPVVNEPNLSLASVVNQPMPGSKVLEHTRMLKRSLDASKPTKYETYNSYKRRMLGFKADSTDDEDEDEDDDGSAPVVNQPKPGSAPVTNQPKAGSAPVVNQPKPGSAPVTNQPKTGSALAFNESHRQRILKTLSSRFTNA